LYKGDGLWLDICECYSWETVINFSLYISFYNMKNFKGIWSV
jgi:hypothetical protein